MNADAFRHFYNYHFAENRKVWEHVAARLARSGRGDEVSGLYFFSTFTKTYNGIRKRFTRYSAVTMMPKIAVTIPVP